MKAIVFHGANDIGIEEEARVMMQEGVRAGAFNKVESQIVHSALELDQLPVPKEGETFESQGYIFEILDMDRHRVDKVLVMPVSDVSDGERRK